MYIHYKNIACLISFLIYTLICNAQNINSCADSSIRIRYVSPNTTFNKVFIDEFSNHNYFAGMYSTNANIYSGTLMKTNRSDSIYFAKRYFHTTTNYFLMHAKKMQDNTIVSVGHSDFSGTGRDMIIVKTDDIGNLLWSKKYRIGQFFSQHFDYYIENVITNITASGNNLYLTGTFWGSSRTYYFIVKLDSLGNIAWSTNIDLAFQSPDEILFLEHPVIIYRDTLITYCRKDYVSPPTDSASLIITKINNSNGNVYGAKEYFFSSDNERVSPNIYFGHADNQNNFIFSGRCGVSPFTNNPEAFPISILFDSSFVPLSASFLKKTTPNYLLRQVDYSINNALNNVYLTTNSTEGSENYFTETNSRGYLTKTRKFSVLPILTAGKLKTINLDNKDNIHFTFRYNENNKNVTEYARISDLNPGSTLQCFGKDTSLFTRQALTVTQRPFTWPVVQHGLLVSEPFPLIQEDIPIEKEVLCWQVSRCDSIKINGDTSVCVSAHPVRYSIYRNPECLKKINWLVDTTSITLLGTEADTAITVSFKNTGRHVIKAGVDNCMVNDSLVINVTGQGQQVVISGDSLLCPGQTIDLQASPGYKTYSWQDGSVFPFYRSSSQGWYSVTAEDNCGNFSVDSFFVAAADTSLNIPGAATVCFTDTAFFNLPSGITNIKWQPTGFAMLRNNRLLFYPDQTTTYTIDAEVPPGCAVAKFITVNIMTCPETVFVPSSFTPNGDGLNDFFKPIVSMPLENYHFSIYNRSGQPVFKSNDQHIGWDGNVNSKPQSSGVFVWQLFYRFPGKESKYLKGTLTLMR